MSWSSVLPSYTGAPLIYLKDTPRRRDSRGRSQAWCEWRDRGLIVWFSHTLLRFSFPTIPASSPMESHRGEKWRMNSWVQNTASFPREKHQGKTLDQQLWFSSYPEEQQVVRCLGQADIYCQKGASLLVTQWRAHEPWASEVPDSLLTLGSFILRTLSRSS